MSLVTCSERADNTGMTMQHTHPRRAVTSQTLTAQQFRHMVGPGHQFPVLTDRVLRYWSRRP